MTSALTRVVLLLTCVSVIGCGRTQTTPMPVGDVTRLNSSDELLTASGLTPREVAIVINLNDEQSVSVGNYYQRVRKIPLENVISIHMTAGVTAITAAEFTTIKAQVDAVTPDYVQAFALTWTTPYRVDGMSITSAFALGYDLKWAKASGSSGCSMTAASPYYNSTSTKPFQDFNIRLAMSLAGTSVQNVKELIDRGSLSDFSRPSGAAYMIRSSDGARSVRWSDFQFTERSWADNGELEVTYLDHQTSGPGFLTNAPDVVFYLASLANVPQIGTNTYAPGAIADHVTSFGGKLTDSSQMSVLRWLEAGATGSYGTVVEPCNFTQKFPKASVLIPRYYGGDSLIEAYWRSVEWPGEGIFVGDPLARPYVRLLPSSH